jgi:hypothetical protein
MPEGCARSGSGMELAKGRRVRAGSRGRGIHEDRVGAVARHAALNNVERISGGERAMVDGRRRRSPVQVRVRRVHWGHAPRGQLCREVLGHAGRH